MNDRQAFVLALKLLGRRDHSVGELSAKLEARGAAPATVEAVVGRLQDDGYLDDRRFAQRWAELAVETGKGYGPRLRLELSRRRVPGEVVAEVMAEVGRTHDEGEAVRNLLERKFSRFAPDTADDREKRRVFAFLQRRGFSAATISQVFRNMTGR